MEHAARNGALPGTSCPGTLPAGVFTLGALLFLALVSYEPLIRTAINGGGR